MAGVNGPPLIDLQQCRRAADYSAQHKGIALIVSVDGSVVWEDYPNGGAPAVANEIASGTKSFTGILAILAAADGFLALDDLVVASVPEWAADPLKSRISIRHLLQLVSGLDGSKPGRVPDYAAAIAARSMHPPGERFLYGSTSFQVFGEVLRRKLVSRFTDPLAYLQWRLLDPMGLRVGSWRRGTDGHPHLSSGLALTAREWFKFGELVRGGGVWQGAELVSAGWLDEAFRGSADNPCYGLAWWLNRPPTDSLRERVQHWTLGVEDLSAEVAVPSDLVYAAGAGKQRLYVSRECGLVVVRQASGVREAMLTGDRGGFSDCEFLRRLLDSAG